MLYTIGPSGYAAAGITGLGAAWGAVKLHEFATTHDQHGASGHPVARPMLAALGAGVVGLAGVGTWHVTASESRRALDGFSRIHAGAMLGLGAVTALAGVTLLGTSLVNAARNARETRV